MRLITIKMWEEKLMGQQRKADGLMDLRQWEKNEYNCKKKAGKNIEDRQSRN